MHDFGWQSISHFPHPMCSHFINYKAPTSAADSVTSCSLDLRQFRTFKKTCFKSYTVKLNQAQRMISLLHIYLHFTFIFLLLQTYVWCLGAARWNSMQGCYPDIVSSVPGIELPLGVLMGYRKKLVFHILCHCMVKNRCISYTWWE